MVGAIDSARTSRAERRQCRGFTTQPLAAVSRGASARTRQSRRGGRGNLKRLWSDEPENEALAVALVSARRRAGDMSGVTEVLRTLVDDATPENAANRWRLLGEHLEEVGQVDGALAAWHRVRTLEPEKSSAWEFEERLLAASGSHRVLLETLIAHAAQPAAAGSRTGALYDHAAKLAESLGDRAQATALQREAQRFPHHHDESILSWLDSSRRRQASPGPDATSASAVSPIRRSDTARGNADRAVPGGITPR